MSSTGQRSGRSDGFQSFPRQSVEQPLNEEERASAAKLRSEEESRKTRTNIEIAFIVLSAVAVIYYTDFFTQVGNNPFIRRGPLKLAYLFSILGASLCVFTIVYLGYIKKVSSAPSQDSPKEIVLSVVFILAAFVCYMISFWPVWGLWTLVILTILLAAFFIVTVKVINLVIAITSKPKEAN